MLVEDLLEDSCSYVAAKHFGCSLAQSSMVQGIHEDKDDMVHHNMVVAEGSNVHDREEEVDNKVHNVDSALALGHGELREKDENRNHDLKKHDYFLAEQSEKAPLRPLP